MIISLILAAALAAALLWVRLLRRDIRQLGQRLADITQTDTNAQLHTNTYDRDIVTLSKNINNMLERNRRDLSDKARAEADLKRAITNISHDLRTPLTSALGYLQMLETATPDAATQARCLAIIRERLEALSGLMNSLFTFTRIIEGNTPCNLQRVNICNVLRDTLSASYAELVSKGFTVAADIPDTPVFCQWDEDVLRRVLQNLLSNVCAHGRDYLRVRVDGRVLEIANKADGLAELDTERMFERFYTADASRTHKHTGLGLAIAKELMTRMGGQITARAAGDLLVVRICHRDE